MPCLVLPMIPEDIPSRTGFLDRKRRSVDHRNAAASKRTAYASHPLSMV